ncbi:DUF4350 domain-containing protein [Novosphingobium sp. YJ-S2-02]|uniref:DUF4350 domain-containing protein n=1 Tax=Novosphingobium aureum TaxID=2792964 RepID=A0A931MJP6_9SPHN|nr:DUF4350 domain-containing protein [Novosphingobium aureum]
MSAGAVTGYTGGSGTAARNPFSRTAALAIVVLGSLLFILLLWMLATGRGFDDTNDGQAHVDGRGLNGFAAMAAYLEARGHPIERARSENALDDPGLLVLTPPPGAEGEDIARIVGERREVGPTLVISPKWVAGPASEAQQARGAKSGWVNLAGTVSPHWEGFLDEVWVELGAVDANGQAARWRGPDGLSGDLPDRDKLAWGGGEGLIPVVTEMDGRVLAAIVRESPGFEDGHYPLVLVFEPDLFDNYGMASGESAPLVDALLRNMGVGPSDPVTFDLTLNGHGRSRNLLTLAFMPPFLSVTVCLLLAAAFAGWRAFMRFGPPATSGPAIAYGKRALVENTAGLVRRSRRFHLLGGPYAERARERLARALGLSRHLDPERTEAAIDRALAARLPEDEPFSAIAARLRAARRPHEILQAARALHALERKLTR